MASVIRVLSLGAGVQSSTIVYMMRDGVLPPADHAIFADTGWEPRAVYDHLNYLIPMIAEAGMTFHRVSRGNIRDDFYAHERFVPMPLHTLTPGGKKGMIPRQCTFQYKIKPLLVKQRELAGLRPRQRAKDHLVTTIIGISHDESQRMRDPAFSWLRNEYPLVDLGMSRADCLNYAQDRGYRTPPRSACIGCPLKTNVEWRQLRDGPSDEWHDAVNFDAALRRDGTRPSRIKSQAFLHWKAVPLVEVDLRTDGERGIVPLFDSECSGMCGV